MPTLFLFDAFSVVAILFLIAGFILLAVEIMIPGFGAPGIAGIICLIAGIVLAADSFLEGLIITLIILILLGIMLVVILWLLSSGRIKSPIVLKEEQTKHEGYLSSSDLNYLLNREGVAVTDLRPSGIGEFDGVTFDVLTEGMYLTRGTQLVIAKVQGSKLIVREISSKDRKEN